MSRAEKLIARGRELARKGKLDKALATFREATTVAPVDPEAWEARADVAATLGETREAADAYFRVADMYARASMPREALRIVARVLELDPGHEAGKRFRRMLESRSGEIPAQPPPRAASEADSVTIEFEAEEPSIEEKAVSFHVEPPSVPQITAQGSKGGRAETPPRGTQVRGLASLPTPAPPPLPVNVPQMISASGSGGTRSAPTGGIVESLQAVAENPDQFALGQTTGEMALESTISLADHLPARDEGVHKEFSLDDEPEVDVLRAVVSAIGSSPLLSELDSDLVRQLIDVGTLTRKHAGEIVFRQGDSGNSLFLILAGEVAVQHELGGESRELARLRAGAFFGEMALITSAPRSATVRAASHVDLLEVSRRAVRQMIDKNPRVLKLLMRFFRARLVGTLLQTSPIFEPFSREDRRQLIAAFRLRELGAGHAVFEEGSKAEGLFVLLAGRLEVLRGLDSTIGKLAPGDVFGEMSLLEGGAAMATVKAKTRSWVLLLPRAAFEELAARHPELRDRLRALAETRKARNAQTESRLEPV